MSTLRMGSQALKHALLSAPTDLEVGEKYANEESIYTKLKALFVNYEVAPGAQLFVPHFASKFRVSVTPVREALIRLQSEGLVDYRPRTGFFARQLSLSDVTDLYHVWYLLVRYGIEGGNLTSPAASKRLRFASTRKLNAIEDALSVRDASCLGLSIEEFFDEIVRSTSNQFALTLIREVHVRTRYVRSTGLQLPGVAKRAILDVKELTEQLASRDVAGSFETLRRHSERMLADLPNALKEALSRLYV